MVSKYIKYSALIEIANSAQALKAECERLRIELDSTIEQLRFAREKLIEAQERNRKLDWLLTQAEEAHKNG